MAPTKFFALAWAALWVNANSAAVAATQPGDVGAAEPYDIIDVHLEEGKCTTDRPQRDKVPACCSEPGFIRHATSLGGDRRSEG